MKNNLSSNILSTTRVILISSLTIFTLYTVQAWVSPLVSAPNGNVGGPLTTATSTQIKTGSLGLLDNLSIGNNLIVNGNVGVGTMTPVKKLDVSGDINLTGGQYVNGVKGYLFGGFYTTASTYCSAINNPLTGGLSCPVGFSPLLSFGALCNASDTSDRFFYVCVK